MKIPVLALALTILPASLSLAQNAPAAPQALLENEQIRVREIRLAPGAKQPSAARPNTFLYALTDGSIVFTPPGRKGYELTFKAGEALWLPSQETATANEGDKEVRALLVEIKGRAPSAAKKGRAPKGKKGSKKGAAKG
jgi:beta-alanine degradation protein BauB